MTTRVHSQTGTVSSAVLIVATTLLQACSSSGSGDETASPAPEFSPPHDAASLRSALITGSPGDGEALPWLCTIDGSQTRLAYQLFSDDSGTESNVADPTQQSSFSWQATSADTLYTVVAGTGQQNDFSDVTFSDADHMSLSANQSLNLSCERDSAVDPAPGPDEPVTGENTIRHDGLDYPLTHGFEEAYSYRPDQYGDTHRQSQFNVADAEFSQTTLFPIGGLPTQVFWRPDNATIWLRADLHSPGADGFDSATFTHVSDEIENNSPSLAGEYFFQEGRLGVDIDQNGDIDSEADEFFAVTGGSITLTRMASGARMSFDLTLSNGIAVSGSFEGTFPLYEHY